MSKPRRAKHTFGLGLAVIAFLVAAHTVAATTTFSAEVKGHLTPSVSAGYGPPGWPGLRVYTLDVDRLIEIARKRLTRTFTQAECIRYLHVDECPRD